MQLIERMFLEKKIKKKIHFLFGRGFLLRKRILKPNRTHLGLFRSCAISFKLKFFGRKTQFRCLVICSVKQSFLKPGRSPWKFLMWQYREKYCSPIAPRVYYSGATSIRRKTVVITVSSPKLFCMQFAQYFLILLLLSVFLWCDFRRVRPKLEPGPNFQTRASSMLLKRHLTERTWIEFGRPFLFKTGVTVVTVELQIIE